MRANLKPKGVAGAGSSPVGGNGFWDENYPEMMKN